jgi:hypothetical protein
MALPNPWYIDSQARHQALTQRLLAYAAVEGQEGILAPTHLRVAPRSTPNDSVDVMPGAYSVLARHLGGAFEAYLGKIQEAENVTVNPTSSSGPRTDLVILRIENPYVSGSGSWAAPIDEINGPYAHVRVIEGVPANTNHISAYNDTWSAITLARITRPANKGIVEAGDITDLRSIAKLGEQRVIIIESPPPTAPPIAQQYWTESTPVGNNTQILSSETNWKDFPDDVEWQVPIPAWAVGVDINVILNPALTLGDFIGDMRLNFGGDVVNSVPTNFNENLDGQTRYRTILMIGGTEYLDPSIRGKVVTVKLQARSTASGLGGRLRAEPGTRINMWLNFKRYPVTSDGG